MNKVFIYKIAALILLLLFSGAAVHASEEITYNLSAAHAMPLLYLNSGLGLLGAAVSAGVMNQSDSFIYLGVDISAVFSLGKDEDLNLINFAMFFPITVEGGVNIRIGDAFTLQPFAGAGISMQLLSIEEDDILFAGAPVREESGEIHLYIDPCITAGIRFPLVNTKRTVTPFVRLYGYPGRDSSGDWAIAVMMLSGIRISM